MTFMECLEHVYKSEFWLRTAQTGSLISYEPLPPSIHIFVSGDGGFVKSDILATLYSKNLIKVKLNL